MFGYELFSGTELLLFTVTFIIGLLWFRRKDGRNSPPGPYSLPVVGYIPFLTFKPYVKLQELSKKYGPVFSIKLGSKYTVVLNDYQSIREAFAKDAFIGRPPNSIFELSEESIKTNAFNGLPWKEQRRFSIQMLRDLGLGKSVMEQHVREEVCELIDLMMGKVGKNVLMSKMLTPSMSNNIASLMFGKRRRFDDPKRIRLDDLLGRVQSLVGKTAFLIFFPWMKPILKFFGLSKQKELTQVFKGMEDYVAEEVNEHVKTLDPSNIRDYIDGYLLEIRKRKDEPNTTFLIPIMKDLVRGFFGAGSETVRITMDWLLLLCAAKQDVQKRVQDEIDEVIGRDKFPSKEYDQKRLPYTTAVIMELMRWRSIIPLNLFRYTIEDTTVSGYDIPKHTYIWANLWAVHHDPSIWGDDVEVFRPERFLSNDGKVVKKVDYFIPFSVGKRSCPGEGMANMEVFMYFTALLQKFHFRLPDGKKADFEGMLGIGLSPKPQELQFSLR